MAIFARGDLQGPVGIEPTNSCLNARCATTELAIAVPQALVTLGYIGDSPPVRTAFCFQASPRSAASSGQAARRVHGLVPSETGCKRSTELVNRKSRSGQPFFDVKPPSIGP